MSTLSLNAANVFEQSLTVDEIRKAMDGDGAAEDLHEKIEQWLDEAQGPVFSDEHKRTYLVIEITN
jgi:hypothetical protein